MKLAVFAFTRRGCGLAQGAKEILDAEEVRLVTMEKFGVPGFEAYRPPLNQCMEPYFRWADAILFIGSTGMAVRAIAPWVRDKKTDPAVLVMDEGGTFVISLLSGHIGGPQSRAAIFRTWSYARRFPLPSWSIRFPFAGSTCVFHNCPQALWKKKRGSSASMWASTTGSPLKRR